jgi:hypothetical protein
VTEPSQRTGICLVPLEEQGDSLLITLVANLDIRTGSPARSATVDVEEALDRIRRFVVAFRAGGALDTTA